MKRLVCILLALCLVLPLWGCGMDYSRYLEALENAGAASGEWEYVPYEEMVYSRPDLQRLEDTLNSACDAAAAGKSAAEILELVYEFYDEYDLFTQIITWRICATAPI